jgi:hypothetical protein
MDRGREPRIAVDLKEITMAKKKAAAKKKSPKGPPGYSSKRPCTPPEICEFLRDELTPWLAFLAADYEKLRIAMCNVEAKAFDGLGVSGKRFPPCGTGPGGDPPPPPPPPKWT